MMDSSSVNEKFGKSTCLVVDDSNVDRRLIEMGMRRILVDSIFEVTSSTSVASAASRIRQIQRHGQVAVIILDWHFSEKEKGAGLIAFCESERYNIPIIVLTHDPTVRGEALGHKNVIGFIEKPLSQKKWALIEELVRKHAAITPAA